MTECGHVSSVGIQEIPCPCGRFPLSRGQNKKKKNNELWGSEDEDVRATAVTEIVRSTPYTQINASAMREGF